MNWKQIIKANYAQLFFVFAAFFLMVLVSYLSVSAIVERHLAIEVKEAIHVVEANVKVGMSEAEATINNVVHNVQNILDGGGTQDDVSAYLSNAAKWMEDGNKWLIGFHRVYGHIRGELITGMGADPGAGFLPQTRPWFDAVIKSSKSRYSFFTEPFADAGTGDTAITVIRHVYGKSGEHYGFIAIDMDISWSSKYIRSLHNAEGAYGMILTRYMVVVGHPDSGLIGKQLSDLGDGYRKIYDMLMANNEISSVPIVNTNGLNVVVSFRKMFNGWSIGVITPVKSYYRDVYRTALILSVLGLVLMSILGYILIRLSAAKLHSDEESKSKSSFLARMSHEIRTPMNVIIGMSELAQREHGTPKALEYIAGIKSASASLLAIVNDILDFSKIGSGQFTLVPAPYETGSLLNDALSVVRIRLGEKPIELIISVDPSLPAALVGDATRVRQVLLNMLSNAVQYTDKGFIRFHVSWQEVPGDAALLTLVVADSGIGVRSENLSRLFDDFVRVDEQHNKNIKGTGLGLSITRSLCQAMGGDITVKSEYGKGSTFTATLRQPIADRRPVGALENKAQAKREVQRISFTAPDVDILLVDDMPSNLLVAEGLLTPYKARIFTCQSGREAVDLVRSRPFDLIFMDHMMPGMDGMEATASIRGMGKRGKMPIVALTANTISGMRETFLQNGFDDFLSKPIEIPKLAGIMEKWIPANKRGPAPDAASSGDTETVRLPPIEGVDTLTGLAQAGGVPNRYLDLLEMFCRDARTRLPLLAKTPAEEERKSFTTQVHALKSALASIGAAALSADAARLENAGRNGDIPAIDEYLPAFREDLEGLLERIGAALAQARPAADAAEGENGEGGQPSARERELLALLKTALEQKDLDAMDKMLEDLKALQLTPGTREALSGIAECILLADFQKAEAAVDALNLKAAS
jgi:signal transduction histidine kinase/DNA-binding response OmpR family regulator